MREAAARQRTEKENDWNNGGCLYQTFLHCTDFSRSYSHVLFDVNLVEKIFTTFILYLIFIFLREVIDLS